MRNTPASGRPDLEARVLAGRACNEDAVVLRVPPGHALVQSVDVLTPVVNDAFAFGRIAAANALSDIYAMGGEPWSAMNVAFFPPALAEDDPEGLLTSILRGGLDAMNEAGAVLAGGHTVQDEELKYGLAVTGVIDPEHLARNDGLKPGQVLLLTKPLGTGVLSTAVKAGWDGAAASEANLVRWCGRLNSVGGTVIRELRLSAATDITGFGLGGHALEMALASHVCVRLVATALPLLPRALEYARDGLIPAGSHRNRTHCACRTRTAQAMDEALESLAFDAQTSGGLLLAVPPDQVEAARALLLGGGDLAAVVGEVLPPRPDGIALLLE
ncbi:Selenide,water dikinase (EC @ selenocysteine-containing [Desulfovibrio diazotrophicus]|nr:Selenide,water dikinase (EC @ selenocysteine-containing [Desulfovibrio diazotrophicus]